MIGLARSNAREFAARGVTVNTVCPGFINSDMTGKLNEKQKVSCYCEQNVSYLFSSPNINGFLDI